MTDVFTDACVECEPDVFEMDSPSYARQLEAMCFGYLDAQGWLDLANEKIDEARRQGVDDAWYWETRCYLADEYWEPIVMGIERMYGIPREFWAAGSGVTVTRRDIMNLYEDAYKQFELILDGVPVEDVFA